MSRHHGGWAPYVPVAARRAQAEREAEKLRKKGTLLSPVKLEGKKIAATFWGISWCDNLESYHDFENRLPRGRTYVRNGSVIDLQIAPREITALVSGSSIYKIKITVAEAAKSHWKAICTDCSGGIDSLVELLQGRFSKGVMERICRQGAGLFPEPSEIKFSCSCPDWAGMCKHVAAALYGVGARLDRQPELLFRLRAVDEKDLVADISNVLPMSKQGPAAGKVLETDDMAALFGLDMGDEPAAAAPLPPGKTTAPGVGKKPAARVKAKAVAAKTTAAGTTQTPIPPSEWGARSVTGSGKTSTGKTSRRKVAEPVVVKPAAAKKPVKLVVAAPVPPAKATAARPAPAKPVAAAKAVTKRTAGGRKG